MGQIAALIGAIGGLIGQQKQAKAAKAEQQRQALASQQQLEIQKKNEELSRIEAMRAESERRNAEEHLRKKRANVLAGGRESTILAGENDGQKTLLGG